MPRGRKGPPQESVDSILLAISRRDDIDAITLSHFFDRLSEEWIAGAREKVLHLLRSSDAAAHAAAILILSELATEEDLENLEDFVADPTVGDLAKLALAPILKELGSEMADDGIVEYLNDPAAAMQQMQLRLLELVDQSEMGVESVLEDVASMSLERRLGFVQWLGHSNDPRATNLLVPLLENQGGRVVTAVIDALEQLGPLAARQAIPALNYAITNNSNRAVKQYARAALGRLTMQAMPGAEDAAMNEARSQQLPPYEARVSYIDGSGSQLIMLSWQRSDGLLKGVNVLYQDHWGIKDCYGIDEMDKGRWNELISELDEQGFGSFQAPFELGRALVLEARALSKRTRRKLPIAYSIWRPFIEGDLPLRKQQMKTVTAIELPILDAEALALVQRGHELYQLVEFTSWLYEPFERLEPYINRYMTSAPSHLLRMSSKRSRKSRQKDQKAVLDGLVEEALNELMDDKWRSLYEQRLRRQAALFRVDGREHDAQLVGAVAAALHPASSIPLQEQPFPRAMLSASIEQGPLRMLAESLNSGSFGNMPIKFFEADDHIEI